METLRPVYITVGKVAHPRQQKNSSLSPFLVCILLKALSELYSASPMHVSIGFHL